MPRTALEALDAEVEARVRERLADVIAGLFSARDAITVPHFGNRIPWWAKHLKMWHPDCVKHGTRLYHYSTAAIDAHRAKKAYERSGGRGQAVEDAEMNRRNMKRMYDEASCTCAMRVAPPYTLLASRANRTVVLTPDHFLREPLK